MAGDVGLRVMATDRSGESVSQTFRLVVERDAAPQAPIVTPDAACVIEDYRRLAWGNVLTNDGGTALDHLTVSGWTGGGLGTAHAFADLRGARGEGMGRWRPDQGRAHRRRDRAPRAEVARDEHDLVRHHLVGDRRGLLGITGVVADRQLELLAVHAARGVDLVEREHRAVVGRDVERRLRAGEREPAGDQYVTLKVVLPKAPDSELEEFVKAWSVRNPYNPRT